MFVALILLALATESAIGQASSAPSLVVVDNAMSASTVRQLERFAQEASHWRFQLRDDAAPWTLVVDDESLLGKILRRPAVVDALRAVTGDTSASGEFFALTAAVERYRRGDLTPTRTWAAADQVETVRGPVAAPCSATAEVLLFANVQWDASLLYGEFVLYNATTGDVERAVTPRLGRAVVLPTHASFALRPSSVLTRKLQNVLRIRVTRNLRCVRQARTLAHDYTQRRDTERRTTHFGGFPLLDEVAPDSLHSLLAQPHHITHRYRDSQQRDFTVFDGLFSADETRRMREWFSNYTQWTDNRPQGDPEADNVNWISILSVDQLTASSLWPRVKATVDVVRGRTTTFYPYDVSVNLVRSIDDTRIHEDCNRDEDEYTFLVYLNDDDELSVRHYGETAYYQRPSDCDDSLRVSDCDESWELVGQIRPRLGRVALHQGHIPHSARPPAPSMVSPRFTFAVKMSVNERVAREKRDEDYPDEVLARLND